VQLLRATLQPIAALPQENQTLLKELQLKPFTEKDSGILESYLAKIRRKGIAKNADMKQRLDQFAENNTAIVTPIKAYSPHAMTPRSRPRRTSFATTPRLGATLELGDGTLHGRRQLPPPLKSDSRRDSRRRSAAELAANK